MEEAAHAGMDAERRRNGGGNTAGTDSRYDVRRWFPPDVGAGTAVGPMDLSLEPAMRSITRLALLTLLSLVTVPRDARAQFTMPVPSSFDAKRVRAEDFQMQFLYDFYRVPILSRNLISRNTRRDKLRATIEQIDAALQLNPADTKPRDEFIAAAKTFCESQHASDGRTFKEEECKAALDLDALRDRFGFGPPPHDMEKPLHEVYFIGLPLLVTRSQLSRFMRESGATNSFTFANQFAANVSDDEAYVVTNIVRGLAGRSLFSADYAAVVTKSDEEGAVRDTIESDKANLLRAVNNGGTLVARFVFPMIARTGGSVQWSAGITAGAGLIGPVAESDDSRRHGAYSSAAEFVSALPIRSMTGDNEQTAELVFGLRGGYTRSDETLQVGGGYKDVSFGQAVIGVRQNSTITVSALVTLANHEYQKLVPKLTLNLTALR